MGMFAAAAEGVQVVVGTAADVVGLRPAVRTLAAVAGVHNCCATEAGSKCKETELTPEEVGLGGVLEQAPESPVQR